MSDSISENKIILYRLMITDIELSYEGYSCDFEIGVFTSAQEAVTTAEYYLSHISGFKDYPCKYRIDEKECIGNSTEGELKEVWQAWGYNYNEKKDETELVESCYFTTEEVAEKELKILKAQFIRDEWGIDRYPIGQKCWMEGFVRK